MSELDKGTAGKLTMVIDSGGAPRDDIDEKLEQMAAERGMDVVHGPVVACETCHHFTCVCDVIATHVPDCRYRRSVTCPVAIDCVAHGEEVCSICDTCDCPKAP